MNATFRRIRASNLSTRAGGYAEGVDTEFESVQRVRVDSQRSVRHDSFLSTKFRGRSMARTDRIALRRCLPSQSQHLFNRPLIIGMNAVLTGQDAAVDRDQEVGRQPEATALRGQ